MKKEKELIKAMIKKGAVIYRDLQKEITTCRLVDGLQVTEYPLALFNYLKEKGVLVTEEVCSFHAVYKIVSKSKRTKLDIEI